ncbi:Fe(3+) ABC transporter substrate-binding protein [cf. Phormidesmis sp. LEGE 11477]|uniref:Fe(3+) ABC transporter substrate-binding protein n=1 Tax=cf. Phormidesmis sp. LEGE 11477 TaxID=1828680 RepID=UPI0018818512|nr:Fe(3+) ABC transporter substrate-binding protein [cf. Phormidesmis sp. LEGE 11477]MBE9063721.1 Fe(3+) ABC transporter substrate-binding protein [cf. Phormidesmis sp. LEGE 11477]
MKISRRYLCGITLLVSLGITACQSGTEEAEQVVNLYSARHYDVDEELYSEFTEETGIQVNVLEGKPDELIERISNEGEESPADVFIAVDAGRLWRAQEAGILQPVSSEVLDSVVPESLREPSGLWYGLTTRARMLVYNTDNVQPEELSTYEDLADPKWEGRVCVRSSENVYNQSLLGSMVESIGPEATEAWAEGLVSNFARDPEGGDTDQIKAVAAGQCDVAIVNHYYWARLAKSDDAADQEAVAQTALFFPNQEDRGTHVNISGMGLVAGAPNPENAIAFMEFLVSPAAQEVFAESNNEYPVADEVALDPVVSELGDFKVDATNVVTYGQNNPQVNEIVDRAGWE